MIELCFKTFNYDYATNCSLLKNINFARRKRLLIEKSNIQIINLLPL